jgi:hypothetical protein
LSRVEKGFPNLEQVLSNSKELAKTYCFIYSYTKERIIQGSDNEVVIRYTQNVHNVSGPALPDFVVECVDTLRKNSAGEWKFIKSDNLSIE